jgi:hypothetical protein
MAYRQRLLALLEVYDTAIEELYVLGDRGLVDLILRLERRRIEAALQLAELNSKTARGVLQSSDAGKPTDRSAAT